MAADCMCGGNHLRFPNRDECLLVGRMQLRQSSQASVGPSLVRVKLDTLRGSETSAGYLRAG